MGGLAATLRLAMPSDSSRIPNEQAAVAVLLALFGVGALASASVHSGVPDEVAVHLPAGFLFLKTGIFSGGLSNPPLGQVLIALPAWLGIGEYSLFEAEGLFAPRAVVTGFGLLAAIALVRFGRNLAGSGVALGALFFLATSPNFIAHASLGTLDVPIATAIFIAVAFARRCAISGAPRDFAMLGMALGIACAIKVQGIAAVPLVAAQIALAPGAAWRTRTGLGSALGGFALALAIAWLVVHAAYGFGGLVAGEWLPSAFVEATWRKFAHGTAGHTGYLFGELSTTGSWLYFPVALLVKTPVPLLIGAAIGGVALLKSRELAVWVGLPAALFFAMAAGSSVNIGIRHLMPFFPFFFLLGGLGLARIGRVSRPALGILCAVQLAEALWIAPHGLGYFNVFGGGSEGGYRVLLDSNFDWGQHDEDLRAYLKARPEVVEIAPDAVAPRTGRIIVGASALHGILGPPNAYAWLRKLEPTARVANSWFVYDVALADVADAPKMAAARELRMQTELVQHVLAGARDSELAKHVRARMAVAQACWALFEYGCTLDQTREVLAISPGHRGAFWLASELTARRRLGALRFQGLELLDGFQSLNPSEEQLSVERLLQATRRLEPLGVRAPLIEVHASLGDIAWSGGEWTQAAEHFRRNYALDPEGFVVQFKLGWLLATHPDESERDGALALELAFAHGEQAKWAVAAPHDLHAAALAELGRFDEAQKAAARAIQLAGSASMRAELEVRSRGYAAGMPHRQPRKKLNKAQ